MSQALFAVQAASQVSQGYSDFENSKIEDKNQLTQADIKSRFLRAQAADSLDRSNIEANKINADTTRMRGQQRAAYAGQGVQTDTGSAGEVGAETTLMGANDALTAKNNGWREAWGLNSEADNIQAEARAKSVAAKRQRIQTIATAGLNVAKSGVQAYGARPGNVSSPKAFVPRNSTEARFNYENDYRRMK